MIEKKGISPFLSLSPSKLIGERGRGWHQMDYSVKFVLFTLSGLKEEIDGFRVKFVSDLMDIID